jgi:WD40 repeat protein
LSPDQPTLQLDTWELQAGSQPGDPLVQAANYQSSTIEVGASASDVWLFDVPGILGARFAGGHYRFWDLGAGGQQLYDVDGCPDADIGFSSQAVPRVALACVSSGTVEIWDPTVPAKVATLLVTDPKTPLQILLSPDAGRLVTIDSDGAVQLWNIGAGQKIVDLEEHAAVGIFSVKFSRDGRYMAVSDCAGTAVIRDAMTGSVVQTLRANLACITGLDFSPDDRLLAVNSRLRGLIVWDWNSGRELAVLPGGGNVQFTPDGRRLIATVFDQTGLETFTVRMFTLQRDELVALANSRVTRSLTGEECRQFLHVDQCP